MRVLHKPKKADDIEAVAQGWKWLRENLGELHRLAADERATSLQQITFREQRGCILTTPCSGTGLSARLDAALREARDMEASREGGQVSSNGQLGRGTARREASHAEISANIAVRGVRGKTPRAGTRGTASEGWDAKRAWVAHAAKVARGESGGDGMGRWVQAAVRAIKPADGFAFSLKRVARSRHGVDGDCWVHTRVVLRTVHVRVHGVGIFWCSSPVR